jgi:hypothetical protein
MKEKYADLFRNVGREVTASTPVKEGLYGYVCHLYGFEECSDVNSVRFQIFKGGKYDEESMPPNQDSLDQHVSRANYQCYIWRHASQPLLNMEPFCNHGWKLDDCGNVLVDWMTIPPAPDSVLDFANCKCKKACQNNRCSCLKAKLKCSDLCKCIGCRNRNGNVDGNDESDSDTYDRDEQDHTSSDISEDEN